MAGTSAFAVCRDQGQTIEQATPALIAAVTELVVCIEG